MSTDVIFYEPCRLWFVLAERRAIAVVKTRAKAWKVAKRWAKARKMPAVLYTYGGRISVVRDYRASYQGQANQA